MKINYFLNPFNKIAGMPSLLWGLAAMISASLIGYLSHTHFDGILNVHSGWAASWFIHIAEILLSWLCISLWFYMGSLILSSSKVRAIDIFGTQAFAFVPLLPTSFSGFFPVIETLSDKLKGLSPENITPDVLPMKELLGVMIIGLFILLFVIWSAIWIYQGLKISANLKNSRVIPLYILGIILGMIIPKYLVSLLT